MTKNEGRAWIFLIAAASVVFCSPILAGWSHWGQMDWDQYSFWNGFARKAILEYGQVPLWNPFANGGNPGLAHPHSPVLSPFFLLVLLFGTISGLKLQILLHFFIGAFGAFRLARDFGASPVSGFLSGLVFMGGGIFPLHIAEGHASWMVFAFVPWVLLSFRRSLDPATRLRGLLAGAAFLSLMVLAGGVDVPRVSVVFLAVYAAVEAVRRKNLRPLGSLAATGLVFVLLCSVKLLPMWEFMRRAEFVQAYPRAPVEASHRLTAEELRFSLLHRDQAGLYDATRFLYNSPEAFEAFDQNKGAGLGAYWHECGAYVGAVPLLLALLGAAAGWRKNAALLLASGAALVIALGASSPVNLWGLLHLVPGYASYRFSSRFLVGFVLGVSVFAGLGLSWLGTRLKSGSRRYGLAGRFALLVIVSYTAIDLWSSAAPVFALAFPVPPLRPERAAEFSQRDDFWGFEDRYARSGLYANLLANHGEVGAYEVVRIPQGEIARKPWTGAWLRGWEVRIARSEQEDRAIRSAVDRPGARGSGGPGWGPWTPVPGIADSFLFFDLSGEFQYGGARAVYLRNRVRSEVDRSARVDFFREGAVAVWRDGLLVLDEGPARTRRGEESAEFILAETESEFVIRLAPHPENPSRARFALGRFVDERGLPAAGLSFGPRDAPEIAVRGTIGYPGEAYAPGGGGRARLSSFSPNKVSVAAEMDRRGPLVLNQNFDPNWGVRVDGRRAAAAPLGGLVSVELDEGSHRVEFSYLPLSFLIGLLASTAAAAGWLRLWFRGPIKHI